MCTLSQQASRRNFRSIHDAPRDELHNKSICDSLMTPVSCCECFYMHHLSIYRCPYHVFCCMLCLYFCEPSCLHRDPDKRQDAQELLKHRWVEMCDVPGDELDYENGVSEGHGPSGATLEAVGTPQGGSHNRRRSIMNQDHIVRSTTPSFTKHRIPTPLHLG